MQTTSGYRYPGSAPFQDTSLDRKLFFGRAQDAQTLLHTVLAENPVILFAKSGIGKTSLLNAGIMHALREKEFFPLKVRFNDPGTPPLQAVYVGIAEAVKRFGVECQHSEPKDMLWEYFATIEFWSSKAFWPAKDILLPPVLILDQFEEFFLLHDEKKRDAFTTQLASLVTGRLSKELRESLPAGRTIVDNEQPPEVKVVISIREEYVGYLDELSQDIPEILHNRLRLLPLQREQARQAIMRPAQVEDAQIATRTFSYDRAAVEAMLAFLCKSTRKTRAISTDEVEPFQLQLLCHHLEQKVKEKADTGTSETIIQESDLGGKAGMQNILQNFYDNLLLQFRPKEKRSVRKLCEKGLISRTDLRLSLEEGEIQSGYKVSKDLLEKLVNKRLLRAEPRVGSVYYELSHDTLVQPIRISQKKRQRVRNIVWGVICLVLFPLLFLPIQGTPIVLLPIKKPIQIIKTLIAQPYYQNGIEFFDQRQYDEAIKNFTNFIKVGGADSPNYARAQYYLGQAFYHQKRYAEAVESFTKLKKHDPDNPDYADAYYYWGRILYNNKEYDSAGEYFTKAITLQPEVAVYYKFQGNTRYFLKRYAEAETSFKKARLYDDPENAWVYEKLLGVTAYRQKNFEQAVQYFKQAISGLEPTGAEYARVCYYLGRTFEQLNSAEAITYYLRAFLLNPKDSGYYTDLMEGIKQWQAEYEDIDSGLQQIRQHPEDVRAYDQLGVTFNRLEMFAEAIVVFRQSLQLNPDNKETYNNLGYALIENGQYQEAFEQLQQAIDFDPNYAEAYNNRGRAFYRQGRYDEAIVQYQLAIRADPENAIFYNNWGYALLEQEKYVEALIRFDAALERDPKFANAYNGKGQAYFNQKKYYEAIAEYQKALEIAPDYAKAYTNLGRAYSQIGQPQRATQAIQTGLAAYPQYSVDYDASGTRDSTQEEYDEEYDRGYKLYQQGRGKEAIGYFLKAFLRQSENFTYYETLKIVLQEQKRFNDSIAECLETLYKNAEDIETYNTLAIEFYNLFEYDWAIAGFMKIIQLNPQSAFAYYNLGIIFSKKEEYREARKNYLQAFLLTPQNRDYSNTLKDILSALTINMQPYLDNISQSPDNTSVYSDLGFAFWQQTMYAEAIVCFQKGLEVDPENSIIKENLAELHLLTNSFDTAFTLAKAVLKNYNVSVDTRLAMQFIVIAALLFQEKQDDFFSELNALIAYHKSINREYSRSWRYDDCKQFISITDKLSENYKILLLNLIDILESSKWEADRKLVQFEAWLYR